MILLLILAGIGFANAYYLHYQYERYVKTGQKMFCILGGHCQAVVASRFGTTLGIKNEVIGMTYYALMYTYASLTLLRPELAQPLGTVAMGLAIAATCFSVYLVVVQTFVLRKLCSWCLIAIFINILILVFLELY